MTQHRKTLSDGLRKAYVRKGIVLVLGAGVSLESGIPSWEELLLLLANWRGLIPLYHSLKTQGFSLAAIAAAIESRYDSREEFVGFVRRALYAKSALTDVKVRTPGPTLPDLGTSNPTLRAVAAMCVVRQTDSFLPNPRIHCVVTFNLDTLLETFANARYGTELLRAIAHPAISSTPKFTSVYHMHGVVPVAPGSGERVVLTEHDYFDFFGEPFGAFSYTFLYLLREYSCVFVGLSMRDDNLRRLLHYSAKERRAALEKLGTGAKKADVIAQRHFALLARQEPVVDEAIDDGLARMGVRTLWIEHHNQLQDLLGFVYEGAGTRWGDVI